MSIWKKIVCNALYGGVTKEEYDRVSEKISLQNRDLVKLFSLIVGIILFLLFILSFFADGLPAADNRVVYLLSTVAVFAVYAAARHPFFAASKYNRLLIFAFHFIVYAFAFYISLLHRDVPAVTAVVVLFVCPIVFLDRPVNIAATTSLAVLVFSLLAFRIKPREIALDDTWNMVSFGILSVCINVFLMRMKMRLLVQQGEINFLGTHDLMTGLKNRNSYEKEVSGLFSQCAQSVSCVFIDVNGLHTVNNTRGHAAGDEMLRTVARSLCDAFGKEHGYRTGGDEFIFFALDIPEEKVRELAASVQEELRIKDYFVALGVETAQKQSGDVTALILCAERVMYEDKRKYYQLPENNRRHAQR